MVTRTTSPEQARMSAGSTTGHEGKVQVEQTRAEQTPPDDRDEEDKRETRSATLRLPFLTARFEVPPAPRGRLHFGPVTLPSPGKAAYYASLGLLAAVEIIEWPIAVAVAAGTYVAQHTRADEPALPHLERGHGEPAHAEPAEAEAYAEDEAQDKDEQPQIEPQAEAEAQAEQPQAKAEQPQAKAEAEQPQAHAEQPEQPEAKAEPRDEHADTPA
jgi:hypothetical protein